MPWLGDAKWGVLPSLVLSDRRLLPHARLVYSLVADLSKDDRLCTMSIANMSGVLGLSQDTLKDDLVCLMQVGLLELTRRPGKSNGYRPRTLADVYGDDFREAVAILRARRVEDSSKEDAAEYLTWLVVQHRTECPACRRKARDAARRARSGGPA